MKRINYIILSCCVAMLTVSCDSFLDITPVGQIKRDDLLKTPEGIEDAMYGAYASLRSNNLYGKELTFSTVEMMANTMLCSGNEKNEAIGRLDYEHSSVVELFASIWTEMYKNISNVNSVLNSPLIDTDEPAYPYNIYKGEALGLRAFMHFDLVRLFCKQITLHPDAAGIPYATEFSLKTPNLESLSENYVHILDDLYEAERLLADEHKYENESAYMQDRQIHFNLHAVRATIARVLLTMGNKQEAYAYAKKVIEDSGCELKGKTEVLNDLAGILSQKETIFGVYHAGFFPVVYEYLQQTVSFHSLNLRGDFMKAYENNLVGKDFRVEAYFTEQDNGGSSIYRLSKFTDIYELKNMTAQRPEGLILGINMIRLPEMYYIAAECLLETAPDSALVYYDAVLEHRGITPYSQREVSTALTQEMINEERFKEYIGEGMTFYEMKRQGLPITSYDGETVYTSDKFVVPIPDEELEYRQ